MSSRRRIRAAVVPALAAALAAVLAGGALAPAAGAEPPAPPAVDAVAAAASAPRSITLVTGDTVTVTEVAGGRRTASITPAAGRESVVFHTSEVDGALQVLPSDAVPFVSSGALDARLFDVTALLADGYADRGTLPLVARYRDADAPRTQAVTAATVTRALDSVDGAAWAADAARLGEFWSALTPGDGAVAARSDGAEPPQLAAGVAELWLDGRVRAHLADSVAQIGATTAWEAGFDGSGVDVAVLDTGADLAHPDLVGRVGAHRDFSDSATGIADLHGHGTHVASTVAGTGAASGGRERGVAYGAELLVGKVLGDDGSGYESAIIAGMEWAADEGAEIVNMSLGGGATDGTDPLSVAVDRISDESGTLFVVAAGNEGKAETVGTPGAAAAALTVAAVDADGALADFSSRGPRVGDKALKPDISAPGVAIVAARAAGTAMGEPVDESYTAASGTSMATPHVAGAAALLRQQHPDWTGVDLKAALMSSAVPNPASSVWEQGVGEADVARAIAQPVRASGVVDFARVGDGGAQARAVTYINEGATDVELSLALDIRDIDGVATGSAAFAVPARVTVPAGGTAEIEVTLDAARLERGRWSGHLVATTADGDIAARTAVGALRTGPAHEVTVTAVGFDGQPDTAEIFTLFGAHSDTDHIAWVSPDEPLRLEVEEGVYFLHGSIDQGGYQDERVVEIADPELVIDGDTEIVLDARLANRVQIRTPEPARGASQHGHYVQREFPNGRSVAHGTMSFEERSVWVAPTEPVADGAFEFSSRWQMARPSALLTAKGLETPEVNLLPDSPVFAKPRTLPLVATGADFAGARGKAAIVTSTLDTDERALVEAAAGAGVAALVIVRSLDTSIRTVFQPDVERGPIPAMVTTVAGGEQLLALAARGGSVTMDLRRSSPYLYDVQQISTGHVPDEVVHEVTTANSHRIRTTYADTGAAQWVDEQRFAWRPWQEYAWNDARRLVESPSTREEWVSAGDSLWQHRVSHFRDTWAWGPLQSGLSGPVRSYEPGRSDETWHGQVLRSAAVHGVPSQRENDLLRLRVAEFVDADGHYAIGETTGTATRLYRGDALVAESDSGVVDTTVPADAARYRFELDVRLDDPQWTWSRAVDTSWTFRSERPAEGTAADLPLLQVAYDPPVDAQGLAPSRVHLLPIRITHADGSAARPTTKVWLSSDGGTTWKRAVGHRVRDTYYALVPRGTAPVSVKVEATLDADTSVRQSVIDAYGRR